MAVHLSQLVLLLVKSLVQFFCLCTFTGASISLPAGVCCSFISIFDTFSDVLPPYSPCHTRALYSPSLLLLCWQKHRIKMANTPRVSRRKLGPAPVQEAKVRELAKVDHLEVKDSSIEKRILDRIRKCLATANHPNTGESEAKAAWHLSTRLMQQYNVTQADLLERAINKDDYAAMGGQSTVAISRAKDDGLRVTHQAWVNDVGAAMAIFFDCKHYTAARARSIDWTYYGPAANTVPAAMAFEMAHNLALEWARTKGADKISYCLGIGAGLVKQAHEEKRLEKKRAEETEQKQREQTERNFVHYMGPAERSTDIEHAGPCEKTQKPIAVPDIASSKHDKMHGVTMEDGKEDVEKQPSIKPEEDVENLTIKSEYDDEGHEEATSSMLDESDDDDTSSMLDQGYVSDDEDNEIEPTFKEEDEKPIDFEADFEDQLREAMATQKSSTSDTAEDDIDDDNNNNDRSDQLMASPWNSSQALVRFRQSSETVATEYLKAQNMKLGKAKKRKRTIRNDEVYRQGVKDSKDIDVKRRKIEGANAKEKYCSNCGRYLLVSPLTPKYPGLPTKVECHCTDE